MKQVTASGLREVQRFARGLERDKEEVLAGLTLVYSNSLVEGKVNKLKLIKRMMFGRAEFPCCVSGFSMRCNVFSFGFSCATFSPNRRRL
jgi:transposase